ncbi:MAG: alanine/glycine:cation symporter family protein [Aureliella sp.]
MHHRFSIPTEQTKSSSPWRTLLASALACMLSCVIAGNTAIAQDESGESATTAAESEAPAEVVAQSSPTMESLGLSPRPEQPEWLTTVDGAFGDYIVTPMANVLFFGIEQWLNMVGLNVETSIPFIVIWLFVGAVFFTLRMGFINIRGFWHAIRLTKGDFDDDHNEGEVSHFQALSSALSGTVGLGNIAGVAIAIGQGGPGATFWIIVVGLLGMTSKFTECALGQMYRRVDDEGRVSGGPMRYLSAGLKEMKLGPLGSVLGVMFAILCIGGSFGGGNTFQISQSLDVVRSEISIFDDYPWLYGLIMSAGIGLVIIGGIKSIGKVASRIVPFMCAGYVFCAIYILLANFGAIPGAFGRIVAEAFTPNAAYGGFLGVLVIGIKRAVFSNEAGAGSASIAHSAAKTDIPIREGFVALLEPFIDTVVVCTMTALVIIITGVVDDPTAAVSKETLAVELRSIGADQATIESLTQEEAAAVMLEYNAGLDRNGDGELKVKDYIDLDRGAFFTKLAFVKSGNQVFVWFLIIAVMLFAYSTCISWYYYGERCFTSLFGDGSSPLFKVLFLVFTFLGSVVATTAIKDFSDMLILGMAFPNMLGMYFLSGRVKRALDSYWSDVKAGKFESKS